MNAALQRAGVTAAEIGFVEAHGAGTAAGDLAEAGALERVFPQGVAVGSVKPNIGALDAAGGVASVIKTVLALRHGAIPAILNRRNAPEHLVTSTLRFPSATAPWPGERRALVHAYGLGGVNAALVLEAFGDPIAEPSGVVASFYDFVARPELAGREVYLTLAPFAEIVPGFSWTRTFQDPAGRAAHWDLMLAAQKEMRAALFAHVEWGRVRRVLDFGCGVGTDLAALATQHRELESVGFTISPEQAALAQRRLVAAGLDQRVTVLSRDSARDPFPGLFDLVFGFEVAHHIQDKDSLFANIAAHLAPGGKLVLADNLARTVAPVNLPDLGSWTLDQAGYADLFTRHGLRIVDCVDCSQDIANFLADPDLESMLASEQAAQRDSFALAAAVQRSWHAFGEALATGLMAYVLVTAERDQGADDLNAHNRQQVGLA
jgi:SAM-dependent methyltransferase